jgi:ankyrin repeat protein
MKRNAIDAGSFPDPESYRPLIMEALSGYGCQGDKSLVIMRYLLNNGADPNTRCKSGYHCFHMALQDNRLVVALKLLLEFKPDVNITDNAGADLAYWAIQRFAWNFEGAERQMHLNIIEKLLMPGADIDQPNIRGMTPRKWLEHKLEDVLQLVEKCEALHPAI